MMYAVRFDTGGKVRNLPLKYLAYAEPSPVQLSVGARVSKTFRFLILRKSTCYDEFVFSCTVRGRQGWGR